MARLPWHLWYRLQILLPNIYLYLFLSISMYLYLYIYIYLVLPNANSPVLVTWVTRVTFVGVNKKKSGWISAALGGEPKNVRCGWLSWGVTSLHRWGLCDNPALMLLVGGLHLEKSTASEKLTWPPAMYEQLNPGFSEFGGVCSRLLRLGWRSTLNVPIRVWNLAVPRCSLTPACPGVLLPGFNYTKIDGIHYLRCHCNITYLRWSWSPYLWRWTALKYLSCLLKVIC